MSPITPRQGTEQGQSQGFRRPNRNFIEVRTNSCT